MKKKRALVLSGGGSKGAYSVGVVKALMEAGRQYDVIAGVSVGALIGAHLSMFPPEKQAENLEGLLRVWQTEVKGNKSIYKNWAPGFLTYIWSIWKGGIYNMRPLKDILLKEVKLDKLSESGVEFEVGVISLQSGKYKGINLTSDVANNLKAVDWIWASSVFPVLFPAVEIDGEQWVDGGVRNVIPLKDVLKYEGVEEVDVVITSPRHSTITPNTKKYKSGIMAGLRAVELSNDEVYVNDLIQSACSKSKVKINVYDPKVIVNEDSFEFNQEEINKIIEIGYNETKEKLEAEEEK